MDGGSDKTMKQDKKTSINRKLVLTLIVLVTMVFLTAGCNFPRAVLVKMTPETAEETPVIAPTPGIVATKKPEQTITPESTSEYSEEPGDAPILFTPAALEKANQPDATSAQVLEPSAESKEVCGRTGTLTLLLLGIDEHAQADAIRIIRVNFDQGTVNLVSIPRDFYIPIIGFENYGINQGRINATFGYGEYFLGSGTGAKSLADNLNHNFGIQIDHTFVLHLDTIANYIDAIGGITLNLEQAASDARNFFPAGVNQMDGEKAVAFMRIREYDSDFARIDRQTIVLKALLEKVQSGLKASQIISLISALARDKSTQTDLTVSDMYMFYCLTGEISKADIHVHVIPSSMYHSYITNRGAWVLIPHQEALAFLLEALEISD